MKKLLTLIGTTALLAWQAQAQTTNVLLPPGEIAVFKAGDSSGTFNISKSKVQPCFVQVFDTVTNGQAAPLVSVTLPTNAPNGIWINAHAGSEGGGISRSVSRQFLALEGYTGDILSPTAAKPSAAVGVTRGLGVMDAFGTEQVIFQDAADWFGLPPGVTQNNPTGIATTDGTNFWGTGNVTGTSSEAAGTLFYNGDFAPYDGLPQELQNYIQAAAEARIIAGTLYVVVPGQGVYNFLDPENNDAVVPLPFDPDVPNPVEHVVLTNLFLNWGNTFQNVANFDMNGAGTVAYGADQTFGIVKFVNTGGSWQQAPYFFSATNIGTLTQSAANQGCFGICVDFSGSNAVIYATTMENGITPNAQGNVNQNRLIRIVDNGDPGTNVVAMTLATAVTTNESFRGIDFTPDLRPLITTPPANYATTNGGSAFFSVAADSVFPLSYQWLQNGTNLDGQTNTTLTLNNLTTDTNGFTYQVVVTNQYGIVTSTPPAILTVTLTAQIPQITNGVVNVTNFVNATETFAPITPTGTEPFSFQWYHGNTQLQDDGVKYSGSTTASLSVSNLNTTDDGNYSLVVTNAGGMASNVVDNLTVIFHAPTILAGEPASVTTFVGLTAQLVATESGGSPPVTNQWYRVVGKATNALPEGGDFTGTGTTTLVISSPTTNDAGSFLMIASNGAGNVSSGVATLTVLVPPPHSFVAYSNQVYTQTFDSLPDPGSNSVNSINNPKDAGSIKSVVYSLANPFDFAFPVINNSFVGGLGLSNTMPGWYGAADTLFPGVDGITRFGAQDGDQTTGGVIDFGPNDGTGIKGTNRALGLLSTSTTGATSFALKLINTSTNTLDYFSISFTGELWHNGTGTRTMSFGYTLDSTATNFDLTAESISNAVGVPELAFSFPVAVSVTTTDGTQATNQTDLSATNVQLMSPWTPGSALWLIWGLNFYGAGGGNGYAIDNLQFSAITHPVIIGSRPELGEASFVAGTGGTNNFGFSFTNTPGASFTIYAATNLAPPVTWTPIGSPVETPSGAFSTYSFTDSQTAGTTNRFYRVSSP